MEERDPNASPGAKPETDLPSMNDLVPLGHMLLPDTLASAFGLGGQREAGGEHASTEASHQSFWWPTAPRSAVQPWIQGGNHQVCSPWQSQCLPDGAGGGASKSTGPQNLGKQQRSLVD